MRVYLSKADLQQFRRKAVGRWPREYGCLLYGNIRGNRITVKEFLQVSYLSGTEHFWYDHSKVEEERPSGQFLGTIHSHPDRHGEATSPLPSEPDWHIAIERNEVIQGICHVRVPGQKPRTIFRFYLGAPATLDYVER